jgi:3-oxoacyl-[acyl-carrier protein] reductase
MSAGANTVIVTGATGGIGPDVCRRLAAAGSSVAAVHEPTGPGEATARVLVEGIVASGGRAMAVPADVSDEGQVVAMVDEARRGLGPITGIVCGAAISVSAQRPWREFSPEDWNRILAVNVTGAAMTIRAAYDDLMASGRGSVVILSSVTPLLGRTHNLPYVASKAALIGLTRSLARECGPDGVRVNAIAPGAIVTPDEEVYGTAEELREAMFALQSLHRRGVPDDIAAAAEFLLSANAAFITGQVLVVDGGWVMP